MRGNARTTATTTPTRLTATTNVDAENQGLELSTSRWRSARTAGTVTRSVDHAVFAPRYLLMSAVFAETALNCIAALLEDLDDGVVLLDAREVGRDVLGVLDTVAARPDAGQ